MIKDPVKRLIVRSVWTEDGCRLWVGGRGEGGYGQSCFRGTPERVHRISFRIFHGPIPKGLFVCHTCDRRCCINPEHLFLGTSRENTRDKVRKGRQNRGGTHGGVLLTEAQVLEIKSLKGHRIGREVAGLYRVSRSTVFAIWAGRLWKHVWLTDEALKEIYASL